MATSIIEADSILALDLGVETTRALLFDVVDGQYRFIGCGSTFTTVYAPYKDVCDGVLKAALDLQEKVGRKLVDRGLLIIPSRGDYSGVDRLVMTHSAGPELRVVTAGLLDEISLKSARNLANSIPSRIVESIGLSDGRPVEAQLDAILKADPDLVIFTGGTDYGAGRSVIKLAELLLLLCRVLPEEKRPFILYSGNQALARKIRDVLGKFTDIRTTANVRTGLDVEDLNPPNEALAGLVTDYRKRQIGGMDFLANLCSTPPLPASFTAGRMISFLSQTVDPMTGVLGVNLGVRDVSTIAAQAGKFCLDISHFGMDGCPEEAQAMIDRWLPVEIPHSVICDYLHQKDLYPESIPVCEEGLAIEQAMCRAALQRGIGQLQKKYPDLSQAYEPILAGGSILNRFVGARDILLMLLDGLQPVGISTVILDQYDLLSVLGAVAETNTVLPVQVLESSAFQNLGTVICPVSPARHGAQILRVHIEYENGKEHRMDIRQGALTTLPVKNGQKVVLHLEPLCGTRIDVSRKSEAVSLKITGGVCGAVIDARGRPIRLPDDPLRRRDLLTRWKQLFEV